jgi:hypothetical protein
MYATAATQKKKKKRIDLESAEMMRMGHGNKKKPV